MAKSKQSEAERGGLLEAIRALARDDGPRLVYADWLEDHGEPERAEFIRLQCEESRLFATDGFAPHRGVRGRISLSGPDVRWARDTKFNSIRSRQTLLWNQHGKRWLGRPVPRCFGQIRVRRGFPVVDVAGGTTGVAESVKTAPIGADWFIAIYITPDLPPRDLGALLALRTVCEVTIYDGNAPGSLAEAWRIANAIEQSPLHQRLESLRVPLLGGGMIDHLASDTATE